jgi:arginase family enzyme
VLDPAHAPGTGTPEAGGLTSRELPGILRGLAGERVVGEAHVGFELLALMLLGRT